MTKQPDNLLILYRTSHIIVAQTMAGEFAKFAKDDIYGQFNLGLHVGDKPSQVLQNRAKLLRQLQAFGGIDSIHWLNQIHSDIVSDTANKLGLTAPTADALITARTGQALAIMTADCVPVAIFADEQGDTPIACIHAGWQGLTNGIIANATAQIRQTSTSTLYAVIGTHISQAAYEITRQLADDIISQVCDKHLVTLDQATLYQAIIKDSQDGDKCLINLTKLTQLELESLGVTVVGDGVPCSYQDARFYSYRAQTHAAKAATGRMAMVVAKLA